MTRAVLFDVDGVLVHGYHARPELQLRWDENLLEDLGIDPEQHLHTRDQTRPVLPDLRALGIEP